MRFLDPGNAGQRLTDKRLSTEQLVDEARYFGGNRRCGIELHEPGPTDPFGPGNTGSLQALDILGLARGKWRDR